MTEITAVLLGISVLAIGIAAFAAVLAGLRAKHGGGRLRLHEVMRRRGAAPPEPMTEATAHDAALAARRCTVCGSQALCDELLAAGRSEGYGLFCPNAHYIEQQRNRNLDFH
jgi:hypothetical protein